MVALAYVGTFRVKNDIDINDIDRRCDRTWENDHDRSSLVPNAVSGFLAQFTFFSIFIFLGSSVVGNFVRGYGATPGEGDADSLASEARCRAWLRERSGRPSPCWASNPGVTISTLISSSTWSSSDILGSLARLAGYVASPSSISLRLRFDPILRFRGLGLSLTVIATMAAVDILSILESSSYPKSRNFGAGRLARLADCRMVFPDRGSTGNPREDGSRGGNESAR